MVVGRVGKYDVVGGAGGFDKPEYISAHEGVFVVGFKFLGYFADEVGLCGGFFHRCHPAAAARQQFERYGAGACEQVEGRRCFLLEINQVFKDIEDVFPGEIGGRPGGYIGGDIEASSTVFSSDYSHGGKVDGGGCVMWSGH